MNSFVIIAHGFCFGTVASQAFRAIDRGDVQSATSLALASVLLLAVLVIRVVSNARMGKSG
jgi:ABC-type arginine transport system permease subunit